MSGEVIVVGILADPCLLDVFGLTGAPADVVGRLAGGAEAGLVRDGWPRLVAGSGQVPAVRVRSNAALDRYARVMGLRAQTHAAGSILGLGEGGEDGDPHSELAAAIARQILIAAPDRSPDEVARRLPMIGVQAASELRGAAMVPSGGDLVPVRPASAVAVQDCAEPFAGFFAMQVCHLRHATHDGGMTPTLRREVLVSGDAVVVLPWDPVRDRVLLIEQFRMAPLLRRDPQPWLLETVAGRVDAGETVEDAARREAREEANLTLTRLFPAQHHYPSPGILGEYLYTYVGIADLPDGIAGVHGLESEGEDIRSLLLPRPELTRLALDGQLTNGPLALLALWLELRHPAIRRQLGLT